MRILIVTWSGGGNTPPAMALARAATAAGHDVRVLGDDDQQPWVASTGARFLPLGPHLRDEPGAVSFAAFWFSRRMVTAVASALDAEPADIVVADNMAPSSLLEAERRGIPRIALFHQPWSFYVDGGMVNLFADGQSLYAMVRGELGLPRLDRAQDAWATCAAVIVPSIRAFDVGLPTDPPANVHHVGPMVDHPEATESVPLPPGDEPLVLVSLSTTGMGADDLLRAMAAALAGRPVRAVVTTGWEIDPATVPSAANVAVVRYAAHEDVLAQAAVAVHHAGHGTTMAALTHGVPMVCMPLGRDQFQMTSFVEQLGCGVVVRQSAVNAQGPPQPGGGLTDPAEIGEAVADAVAQVLADPSYRDAARRIGAGADPAASAAAALAVVEAAAS